MSTAFEANSTRTNQTIDVEVTVEDGVLTIGARDQGSGREVFDYFTEDSTEVENFFREVDEARRDWERQTGTKVRL